MDIAGWLRGLGLEQYEPVFRSNDIDGAVLPTLTAEDLKDLGIASVGHRRRLLEAITALREGGEPAAKVQASAEAERRQLTVMFCDLVGSTELSTNLDPEDLREVIAAYHRGVAETVGRFAGFVAKYMGDGVLVYFGYPQAHEDDAERAVRAGLDLISGIGQITACKAVQVRVGVATGLVVVGDLIGAGAAQEQAVVGETPNLAARLQSLARPGAFLIDTNTRRLVGDLFEFDDLGGVEAKGFPGAVPAWHVLRPSMVESRFEALRASSLTPFVGREEEIEFLLRRWARAKTGHGQVVLVSGEAGIGKSRVAAVLADRLRDEQSLCLRYFCSPNYENSALYPVTAQLERAAGFAREESPSTKLEKLGALLAESAATDEETALIGALLSLSLPESGTTVQMTPQQKKEKTLEALLRQMETLSSVRPLLILWEDVHWIDPTSRELLDLTIARIRDLKVLLVITFRPEFEPPWAGQAYVGSLTLSRLDEEDGTALAERVAGKSLPSAIVARIAARADGIPLVVEELTRALVETGSLQDDGSQSPLLAIPPSLHASLLARLDRLGPAAKEAAQIGAAIGREFPYELAVAAAPGSEAAMRDGLDRLAAAGLIFQRGIPPVAEYQFKHALVQDTAYGTLLRRARQRLHQRIATALRDQSPETSERVPEVLAHHFAAAGQPESASGYWLEAGRRAAARSANVEAVAHLTRGIEALGGVADTTERARQELALQLALGPALMTTRGFSAPEPERAYQTARLLSERLGDDRARFASVWGLWLASGSSGTPAFRRELADELFRVAERLDDRELLLEAHHAGWATDLSAAHLIRARKHVLEALALYDRKEHRLHALVYGGHDPAVCGKGHGAVMLWLLGYPDQAAREARDVVFFAESIGHVPSVGHALWWAAMVHQVRRDAPPVLDHSRRLLALGAEHALKQYQMIGSITHGWALAHLSDVEEGLSELRHADISYAGTQKTYFHAILAETELRAGHFDRAEAALNDAAAIANRLDETWWRAGMLCIEGDILRTRSADQWHEAEERYRAAITIAQEQQAKSLELRAATRLARLWQGQGRGAEARDLLAPVYGWFSEGFETPDLKEAKALLDAV
jgi:class 3 adenylate cyclase/predicted ATPase